MYYWAQEEDSLYKLQGELEVKSERTIIDWRNFCCDVCATYYINDPQQIRGKFLSNIKPKMNIYYRIGSYRRNR